MSAEADDDVEDVVVSVTVPCAVLVVVVIVVVVVDMVIARRDVYVNVGLRFAFCGRGEELWWLVLSFPPLHAAPGVTVSHWKRPLRSEEIYNLDLLILLYLVSLAAMKNLVSQQ